MPGKVFQPSNTMFKDGFTTRLYNRRIICYEKEDSWYMKFVRFTKEDMSQCEKDFDSCIKKMSGYRTMKLVKISKEAFINLTHMGFSYFNPHVYFGYEESTPKTKSNKKNKR